MGCVSLGSCSVVLAWHCYRVDFGCGFFFGGGTQTKRNSGSRDSHLMMGNDMSGAGGAEGESWQADHPKVAKCEEAKTEKRQQEETL